MYKGECGACLGAAGTRVAGVGAKGNRQWLDRGFSMFRNITWHEESGVGRSVTAGARVTERGWDGGPKGEGRLCQGGERGARQKSKEKHAVMTPGSGEVRRFEWGSPRRKSRTGGVWQSARLECENNVQKWSARRPSSPLLQIPRPATGNRQAAVC